MNYREDLSFLDDGRVIEANDMHILVDVEGVEVIVSPRVHHTGCACCGDYSELHASYNRHEAARIERHGEADPLGIQL